MPGDAIAAPGWSRALTVWLFSKSIPGTDPGERLGRAGCPHPAGNHPDATARRRRGKDTAPYRHGWWGRTRGGFRRKQVRRHRELAPITQGRQPQRMGEVKVAVTIRNATDVGMHRRGVLPLGQVRSVTVEAVVATGAVRSCIPVDLKEKLGLETLRHINAQMANGHTEGVELTEAAYIDILDRVATESFLVLGSEVPLGQTALESTDLLVDCNRRRVTTNPDHPNSAVIRIR